MTDDNKFTKNNVYYDKQLELFNKILNILEMQPNDGIYYDKFHLEQKKNDIEKLFDDVKKYYPSAVWKNITVAEDKSMPIIRCILKKHNHKLLYKKTTNRIDGKTVSLLKYTIIEISV
jgi:hypothetical protein